MTSAVAAAPIKVELVEECSFIKKSGSPENVEEDGEDKKSGKGSESGKNKSKPGKNRNQIFVTQHK